MIFRSVSFHVGVLAENRLFNRTALHVSGEAVLSFVCSEQIQYIFALSIFTLKKTNKMTLKYDRKSSKVDLTQRI